MKKKNWIRCGHGRFCPICGKPDWCMVSVDGSTAICARIESDRPAGTKGAGWVHRLNCDQTFLRSWTPAQKPKPTTQNWTALAKDFNQAMTTAQWAQLSTTLGITIPTLQKMRWGWCRRLSCWTIPMRDATGNIIGIRTRNLDGSKCAIKGSTSGLFFAPTTLKSDCLIITEGPSDAAALLDAGFNCVLGRPSCSGGAPLIIDFMRNQKIATVLLVPDRDQPGINGAKTLAEMIVNRGIVTPNQIGAVLPPQSVKDCREWQRKNPDHLGKIIGAEIERLTHHNSKGME